MILDHARLDSPLGPLLLYARDGALCGLGFGEEAPALEGWLRRRFGEVELRPRRDPHGLATALRSYFAGRLDAIDVLGVDPGGTAFQRTVWDELRRIPCGRTVSYSGLAARIGSPRAVRAVGLANGRNPVAIVVPCHRVIAADGSLHGYGGGLDRKRWLLEHEGVRLAERPRQRALPLG